MTDNAPTRISFNRPGLGGREFEYIREAVEGGHTSLGGPFTARVVDLLSEWQGSPDVLLTTSCTDALELSALLLDIKPGDTVIVPSFTFVSSALAFVRAGARLVFADIEPVTLGIDPDHVAQLMDDSVRAVVAVHYAGIGCDIDGLRSVLQPWPDVD
ncbi:MAG: DegT/DnrJ/EryC1/StrS family aminotransferase, partial [Actinomycetota bacterium]|nr:DegT/DnrJ/EryC1/StrS family aminotransferase [Actinomycetota bacterium]